MNRTAAIITVVATLSAGQSLAKSRQAPTDRVPGSALVKADSHGESFAKDLSGRHGFEVRFVRESVLGWGLYSVHGADGEVLDEARTMDAVHSLAADAAIAASADNRWYSRFQSASDPFVNEMWMLETLNSEAAWDITVGSSSQRIGVIDTGLVRDHVEFANSDVAGYDFISDSFVANDGDGRDADYDDSGDGFDCGFGFQGDSYHGTHVAGTIAAAANNGQGIAGLNWNAGIVSVRALGRCGGSLIDIMEGAVWMAGGSIPGVPDIAASDRVSVMNLSLGGGANCSAYEAQVVQAINDAGIIFVAAAGNEAGPVVSPGNCQGAITVAAHGASANRQLSSYSNFGPEVEVAAPGGDGGFDVLSAVGPGNNYAGYQGTSMAAPHIAGAISLMQDIAPNLTRDEIVDYLETTGGSCNGCGSVPSLQLDALIEAVADDFDGIANVEPDTAVEPDVEPDTTVDPEPDTIPADDTYEPNNSVGDAAPVGCGSLNALYLASGDSDWFAISTVPGATIDIGLEAGLDFDLEVYRQDGFSVLATGQSPLGVEKASVVSLDDTVLVRVFAYISSDAGTYSLNFDCGDLDTDDGTAPGDDIRVDDGNPNQDDGVTGTPLVDESLGSSGCSQSQSPASFAVALFMLFGLGLRRRRQ